MAAFIKSIEYVTTTFDTTTGTTSDDISLSKGQDETQCVPFYTMRATAGGSDSRQNHHVGLEMLDVTGTPTVRVHRFAQSTAQEIAVDIFVVEYGSNVFIEQGFTTVNSAQGIANLSGTFTAANSFVVFSQVAISNGADDANDEFIQASFGSTTQLLFDRRSVGPSDHRVYFYAIESDGIDFETEYIEADWVSNDEGPTTLATLANSVTLANAFVVSTYETAETSDDMRDAVLNVALTATDTLTGYRDNGGNTNAAATFGVWVVRASATEFDVQRFALDIQNDAVGETDQSITEIDQTKAVIINSQNIGQGAWSVDGTLTGDDFNNAQHSLWFTSTTNVRAKQLNTTASSGADSRMRFEVVEFELEGAAVELPLLIMAPYKPT